MTQLPEPITQHRFIREVVGNHKGLQKRIKEAGLKDWRFDFAWLDQRVAVEVQGGTFIGGKHGRGGGIEKDCDKHNEAMLLGWKVLLVTGAHIRQGKAIHWIERLLKGDTK